MTRKGGAAGFMARRLRWRSAAQLPGVVEMGSALCALPLRIARFLTPYLAPCKMLGTGGEVAPWFSGTWGLHLLEGACAS